MQEQLAIKAASAYNCTIKPASASAWPLLFLLPAFYPAFYTSALAGGDSCELKNFLFFFLTSKDIQPRDIKVASLYCHTELVSPFVHEAAGSLSASLHSLACPIICHSTLLKSISAFPHFGNSWFYKAVLALFILMLHSFMPA